MRLDRCFGHHACAGVYVRRVLWTSAYTFANTLATGCAYALMHVQFVRSALGERGCGGSTWLWSTCCLAWGIIFDRRKDKGVVCVFSIFNAGGSVCGCVCVYTHTHTHTHCADGVFGCEPRSRDETPGGTEESRKTKSRHIYIRVCVYVYARRRDEVWD